MAKKREDKIMHRMGAHLHQENLPSSKMLNQAQQRRESKKTQSVEPIETGNRGKGRLDTPGGEKARRRRRPSHIDPVGLSENTLQHLKRNTRNRHLRCNKSKCLSASKRSKFEHRFSNSVSSIFNAEDL